MARSKAWCASFNLVGIILGIVHLWAIDVLSYEPNVHIKEILQKDEQKKSVNLSPARASLLYRLFTFEGCQPDYGSGIGKGQRDRHP